MVRPHRKDGYAHRRRVHVRIDEARIGLLDELAAALSLSRAHLCDLILGIAVEEGGDWLCSCIRRRVLAALQKKRDRMS